MDTDSIGNALRHVTSVCYSASVGDVDLAQREPVSLVQRSVEAVDTDKTQFLS